MTDKVDVVQPASGRLESWMLLTVVGLIVLGSGMAVAGRQREDATQRLFGWQISAFSDLKPVDQSTYTALSAASEELWLIHDDILTFGSAADKKDPWPSVRALNQEFLMPPFVKDEGWKQHGETEWTRVASFNFEGSTVFFGSNGKLPGQSAYLINLSHVHKGASYVNGSTIWMHPNPNVPSPTNITRDSLIINGWKEIVPYSGAMEVERLRGK